MTSRTFALPAFAAAAIAAIAGCSSEPLSFINDQQVYHPAVMNRYPLRVVAIDGASTVVRPVPIAAGEHQVTMAAVPVAGFRTPLEKTYSMTIEPCTRYYIAAQRTSPLMQDWQMVIERTFPVDGCDPAQAMQKAAASGPAASSLLESTPDPALATTFALTTPR